MMIGVIGVLSVAFVLLSTYCLGSLYLLVSSCFLTLVVYIFRVCLPHIISHTFSSFILGLEQQSSSLGACLAYSQSQLAPDAICDPVNPTKSDP